MSASSFPRSPGRRPARPLPHPHPPAPTRPYPQQRLPPSPPPSLPPETRLLLASDGSTTLLLESLLGLAMTVHVTSQETVQAAELPAGVLDVLGLASRDRAVRRLSELRSPDGGTVSRNLVVHPAAGAPYLPDSEDLTPLGLRLRALRFPQQHREILACGITAWDDSAGAPACAFKEYVIRCADESHIYIRERFHPRFVPVGSGADRPRRES